MPRIKPGAGLAGWTSCSKVVVLRRGEASGGAATLAVAVTMECLPGLSKGFPAPGALALAIFRGEKAGGPWLGGLAAGLGWCGGLPGMGVSFVHLLRWAPCLATSTLVVPPPMPYSASRFIQALITI